MGCWILNPSKNVFHEGFLHFVDPVMCLSNGQVCCADFGAGAEHDRRQDKMAHDFHLKSAFFDISEKVNL